MNYLGHRIDASSPYASGEKVEAAKAAREPVNVAEIRSYLGLINYYGDFYRIWPQCLHRCIHCYDKEFRGLGKKNSEQRLGNLTSDKVLLHFNPKLDLTLVCDASRYGMGAVLSHLFPDGTDGPIAFASLSLALPEKIMQRLIRRLQPLDLGCASSISICLDELLRYSRITNH